jgi:hypothetical protein
LLTCLGEGGRRQQGQGEKSDNGSRTHMARSLVDDRGVVPHYACKCNPHQAIAAAMHSVHVASAKKAGSAKGDR